MEKLALDSRDSHCQKQEEREKSAKREKRENQATAKPLPAAALIRSSLAAVSCPSECRLFPANSGQLFGVRFDSIGLDFDL